MLYNDFMSAGITLEEIALIEKYAMINNLEFSEDTNDLCLINSITEEVTYRGLSEIIAFLKKDFQERFDAVEYCDVTEITSEESLIQVMELKLNKFKQAA